MRFLERVLAAGPRPDIVWDADAIRKSVDDFHRRARRFRRPTHLIAQVYARTGDSDLRLACRRALQGFKNASADATPRSPSPRPANDCGARTLACRIDTRVDTTAFDVSTSCRSQARRHHQARRRS
jgi:hypothetical protein